MHIVVCVKQILDPEIAPRQFKIDAAAKRAEQGGASLVIGPFDLNAMEVAIQLKEKHGGKVTVVTMGTEKAQEALRRALAMGADEAVLLADDAFAHREPSLTAKALAAAIKTLEDVDLVLCGRQSGEWDYGQVPGLLAEELSMPLVPFVPRMDVGGDGFRLERESNEGNVVVEAPKPLVVSITNAQDNVPRLPKVRDIMMANRKPIAKHSAAELGVDAGPDADLLEVLDLFIPVVDSACEFVEGDSDADKGAALVQKLLERKVI